jgi:hypothetical protein
MEKEKEKQNNFELNIDELRSVMKFNSVKLADMEVSSSTHSLNKCLDVLLKLANFRK